MKFKKSWIFWICYYGVAIIGNVLAAVLLRDHWNFNGWSAFPIACFLLSIFVAWFTESGHAESFVLNQWRIEAEWNIRAPIPNMVSKEANPLFHHLFIVYFFAAPFFLPLIIFLPGKIKAILSIVFVFLGFFSTIIYHISYNITILLLLYFIIIYIYFIYKYKIYVIIHM